MCQLVNLIFIWCFLPSVTLTGVEILCPTFTEGMNVIVCIVNNTAIEHASCSLLTDVTFDLTSSNITSTLCIASPSGCASKQIPFTDGCWCDKKSGEITRYKFAVRGIQNRHLGAGLKCTTCVKPQKHLEENVSEGCRSIHFAGTKPSGGVESGSQEAGANMVSRMMPMLTAVALCAALGFLLPSGCSGHNIKTG